MIDYETFLTELYVMVDDFCKRYPVPVVKPGRKPKLSKSELVTLAIAGQWFWFGSERGFYRYAAAHLQAAFPLLPTREQLNRRMREQEQAIVAFALHLADGLGRESMYEAFDATAVPTRDINRRGNGWLSGITNYGKSNRIGYYEGFNLMASVTPRGVITGYGFAQASTKDAVLADTFLAARMERHPRLTCVGKPACGDYLADKGYSLDAVQKYWLREYGVTVITAPKLNSKTRTWPKALRIWLASKRQVVEAVFEKLHNVFRLVKERPHDIVGFQMRLAAKVALHNFCIYLNKQFGRKPLAFADLIDM